MFWKKLTFCFTGRAPSRPEGTCERFSRCKIYYKLNGKFYFSFACFLPFEECSTPMYLPLSSTRILTAWHVFHSRSSVLQNKLLRSSAHSILPTTTRRRTWPTSANQYRIVEAGSHLFRSRRVQRHLDMKYEAKLECIANAGVRMTRMRAISSDSSTLSQRTSVAISCACMISIVLSCTTRRCYDVTPTYRYLKECIIYDNDLDVRGASP